MKSAVIEILPGGVRGSLRKLGADIARARKKRGLTVAMMAERIGIARSTYSRIERGDPSVALGAVAMTLFVLGLGTPFGDIVDPRRDDEGLMLDDERLPQRVRPPKKMRPL